MEMTITLAITDFTINLEPMINIGFTYTMLKFIEQRKTKIINP